MKFVYEYRSSDNVRHGGIITASDREEAFRLLRESGIRPSRVTVAPGFFNKLFGICKRWIAIWSLSIILVVAFIYMFREEKANRYAEEDRAQIFGDPSFIQKLTNNGWRDVFENEGDSWLARHAIPGHACECPEDLAWRVQMANEIYLGREALVPIVDNDPDEVKKMKRIVNGMKHELSDFATSPEDAVVYVEKACERTRIEKGIYENVLHELARIEQVLECNGVDRGALMLKWDKKNAMLRSMGLRTIPIPESE